MLKIKQNCFKSPKDLPMNQPLHQLRCRYNPWIITMTNKHEKYLFFLFFSLNSLYTHWLMIIFEQQPQSVQHNSWGTRRVEFVRLIITFNEEIFRCYKVFSWAGTGKIPWNKNLCIWYGENNVLVFHIKILNRYFFYCNDQSSKFSNIRYLRIDTYIKIH